MKLLKQTAFLLTVFTIITLLLSLNITSLAASCIAMCPGHTYVSCDNGAFCWAQDNTGCISWGYSGFPIDIKFCNVQE